MKTAVADANVVNAVSSSVREAIHTDTLLAGLYIERRGFEERGGIGFRAPGVNVGIGTATRRNLKRRSPITSAGS